MHLFAQDIKINEQNFPDPAFRTFVNSLAGNTGTLKQATIEKVTKFGDGLKGKGISDLTGLQYFTKLTQLYCQDNPGLTTIDLSHNTALQELNITGCKVTSLDFTHNPDMVNINCAEMKTLASIDISKCSKLQYLFVGNNQLQTLDVTQNPNLKQLSIYKNKLTAIDLSNNTSLQKLWAFGMPSLGTLDLSHNTGLIYLSVYSNGHMPVQDISMLTNLQTLYCFGNNMERLNVSQNKELIHLSCYDNKLTQLDLTNNPNLQALLCFNNQLTELDLSKNPKITDLVCYSNQLRELDLSNNAELATLDCHKNQLTSLTLPSAASGSMQYLRVDDNSLAYFDLSAFTKLQDPIKRTINESPFTFSNASTANQKRRMMLYTDGTDAYLRVASGIDASKISNAKLNVSGAATDITFSVGKESDGLVPLKFSNDSVRKRLFNWASSSATATPITITYDYNTEASLDSMRVMDVTDYVECYLLPMSQEYGTVNLPYDALLPKGATAYAVSAVEMKTGSYDNTATITKIAQEGDIIKANTPMLIRRQSVEYKLFALNQCTGTTKAAENNLLKGTQETEIKNCDNYYVLGINSTATASSPNYQKLGFWRSTNSKIGYWRAYIDLTGTSANAKGFVLSLDIPTGIFNIDAAEDKDDAPWYTIDGRKLGTQPLQKGIYIHNGKKMIITM